MAIKNNTQFNSDISARIPDNTNREIDESDVRESFLDVSDSFFNILGGLGISEYNNTTSYQIGDVVTFGFTIYQRINSSGSGNAPTDPSFWNSLGSSGFAGEATFGLTKIATEAEAIDGIDEFKYITPSTLNSVLSEVGLGGFNERSVAFSDANGFLTESPLDFLFDPATNSLGIQTAGLGPTAVLQVGNTGARGSIIKATDENGFSAFSVLRNREVTVANISGSVVGGVDSFSLYGLDFNGSGTSSPYFACEDGYVINLRELDSTVSDPLKYVRVYEFDDVRLTDIKGFESNGYNISIDGDFTYVFDSVTYAVKLNSTQTGIASPFVTANDLADVNSWINGSNTVGGSPYTSPGNTDYWQLELTVVFNTDWTGSPGSETTSFIRVLTT